MLPLAQGQQAPEALMALVPIERERIEETWDVMGMIGTGSHTVVIEAQHIPAAWAFRLSRFGPRDYGTMSVAAGNSAWPIATSVAAVQLGTSRRALDAIADLVRAKAGKADSALLIDNAHVQRLLMRAEAAWSAANAGVEQALIRMWQDAEEPPAAHRYPDRAVDRQCPRLDNGDQGHRHRLRHRRLIDRARRLDLCCLSEGCPHPRQPYRRRWT